MKKNSFTLIEILIFTSILSIFFIASLTVVVFFLKNYKTQQYKIVATHLLEEAYEWIKYEKESDWSNFTSFDINAGLGTTYCLTDLLINNPNNCLDTDVIGSPPIFKRELLIKNLDSPTTKVEVTITVSWNEINGQNQIYSKQILSILE
ncbi:MAG: hypothetical protein Fur009_3750 [Candidatus Microgenomates bacterium]